MEEIKTVKEPENACDTNYISARELADIERELGEWVNKINKYVNKKAYYDAVFTLKYFSWQKNGIVIETESSMTPNCYDDDEGEE